VLTIEAGAGGVYFSMSRTFSVLSISVSLTSITSLHGGLHQAAHEAASIGNSRWPRSIKTHSCTVGDDRERKGRPARPGWCGP